MLNIFEHFQTKIQNIFEQFETFLNVPGIFDMLAGLITKGSTWVTLALAAKMAAVQKN